MPNYRDDVTTIQIDKSTKEQLDKYRIYDTDTFNKALQRLLTFDREQR